jgi:hypothetical protein
VLLPVWIDFWKLQASGVEGQNCFEETLNQIRWSGASSPPTMRQKSLATVMKWTAGSEEDQIGAFDLINFIFFRRIAKENYKSCMEHSEVDDG